jgi:hypothetical protein
VIAAIVVVAAVVFLAMGRGGGMSTERNDYSPLDLGPVSATDVALLRPPTGLWGYNMQATDEAMEQIAEAIRERDVRIVALEQLVTDLSRRDHAPLPALGPPFMGARHRREAATADSEAVQAPHGLSVTEPSQPSSTAESEAVQAPADLGQAESVWPSAGEEPEWHSGAVESGWSPVASRTAESPRFQFDPAKGNGNGDAPGAAPEEPEWPPTASYAAESPRFQFDPAKPNGTGDVPSPAPEESHD